MNLDVLIIGASSAGLYAADKLARAGKSVGVFEQRVDPLPAARTLIVTPQFCRVLGDVPLGVILHRTRVMRVATRNSDFEIELQDPDLILERRELSRYLASRAEEAGAQVNYGYRFQGLEPSREGIRCRFRTHDRDSVWVNARSLIGADGVLSVVASTVGIRPPQSVPILQARVLLPDGWDPAVTQVWFDTDDTRFFYWLIPDSSATGVVGLVGDERSRMRGLLQSFLDRHHLKAIDFQGARIAMHDTRLHPWANVGGARVLLIGDAAGQVKVTTVGGTVSGLWGADAAVRALLRGTNYGSELRGLKRELDLHWLIRAALDRLGNRGYERMMKQITPPVLRLLAEHNRDEMASVFWRLLLLQPGLLKLGLRGLPGSRRPARGVQSPLPVE